MRTLLWLLKKLPFQHHKAVRYIVSGGTAACLNFFILWALTELFNLWYIFSLVIACIISAAFTFMMQKFWTFENHSLEHVHIQMPQYVMLALVNLVLNSVALFILVEYAHVWYILGQIICSGVLAVMNFLINQHFIFRSREPSI